MCTFTTEMQDDLWQYYESLRRSCDESILSKIQPCAHIHLSYEELEREMIDNPFIQLLQHRVSIRKQRIEDGIAVSPFLFLEEESTKQISLDDETEEDISSPPVLENNVESMEAAVPDDSTVMFPEDDTNTEQTSTHNQPQKNNQQPEQLIGLIHPQLPQTESITLVEDTPNGLTHVELDVVVTSSPIVIKKGLKAKRTKSPTTSPRFRGSIKRSTTPSYIAPVVQSLQRFSPISDDKEDKSSPEIVDEKDLTERLDSPTSSDGIDMFNKQLQEAEITGEFNINQINTLVHNRNLHVKIARNKMIMDMLIAGMLSRDILGKKSSQRQSQRRMIMNIIGRLLSGRSSRNILIQNGIMDSFMEKLHDIVSTSVLANLEECLLLMKSILTVLKHSHPSAEKLVSSAYFLSDVTRLLQMRNFKLLKYSFLVLQSICKGAPERVLFKFSEKDELTHSLASHINSKNAILQRECLLLVNALSYDQSCQTQIFTSGMFHSIILLLSHQNFELRYLALEIVSRFVPSKDVSVDAIILKYGFDMLIQLYVMKKSDVVTELGGDIQADIWKGIQYYSMHVLAYLSDYTRIHTVLLQPSVLKQCSKLLLTPRKTAEKQDTISLQESGLCESSFLASLMLSNLSKFKPGQQQIFNHGEQPNVLSIVIQLFSVIVHLHCQNLESETIEIANVISVEEFVLIPKVVTRTLANMSSLPECQSFLIKNGIIDLLVKAIHDIEERTVIWNCLCTISNLCDTENKDLIQETLLRKRKLRRCLVKYLEQQDDSKLQGRVMRIVGKLSKNPKNIPLLQDVFDLSVIIKAISDSSLNEVKTEGVRVMINFFQTATTEEKVIMESGIGDFLLRQSFSNDHSLVGDICRAIYLLSQMGSVACAALATSGIVQRLWQLKEKPETDKIRKFSALSLRNLS